MNQTQAKKINQTKAKKLNQMRAIKFKNCEQNGWHELKNWTKPEQNDEISNRKKVNHFHQESTSRIKTNGRSAWESITRNRKTVMEQLYQILFSTTEIGGSVSIANTLRNGTENLTDPTIQPTIFNLKQATGTGHSERNHLTIGSLNSGIDVPKYRQNIDNRTGVNPQGPIVTTIPDSNRSNNCNIFDLFRKTSDIAYMGLPRHGTMKNESKNLVENLRGKKNFKLLRAKRIPKLKNLESHELDYKLE